MNMNILLQSIIFWIFVYFIFSLITMIIFYIIDSKWMSKEYDYNILSMAFSYSLKSYSFKLLDSKLRIRT